MSPWVCQLEGGAYDGWEGETPDQPQPPELLIAWRCRLRADRSCDGLCDGHITDDPDDPGIDLVTGEAYQRVEVDVEERWALYRVGEGDPALVEEWALAGVGDLGSGWPVSPI